ncbi:MAG: alginate export family protein [Verrucomicrobiia bacterium]
MKTKGLPLAAALLAFAFVATTVPAQTTSTATVANASSATPSSIWKFDEFAKQVKNAAIPVSWGADIRVRNEYFNNALSLTTDPQLSPLFASVHEQDYFRYRERVWASFFPTNSLTLNVRLTAEPREFMKTSTMDNFYERSGVQWRYAIIDNLNVQWKRPADLPATLTVGRQDIFLGDGWLVGDGTADDGSFTYFFDSVRLTYNLEDQHTTIDAIGLLQYARPDAWLPTLGPSGTVAGYHQEGLLLTDQNEKGAILWVANKSLPAANLDGYFIYKHDTALNDPVPVASFGDNADIYTFGGRVSGPIEDHWKYSAEGAYQFGRKQDPELNGPNGFNPLLAPSADTSGFRDLNAFGAKSKLSYLFKDELNNQLSLSFEFLTGDNPKTKDDEMFDVLWGRWPQWSEMYNVYSYVQETRVGQTANLLRLGPTWSLSPTKKMDFSITYYALFANQDVPTRDMNETFLPANGGPAIQGPFSCTDDFRGHYLQAILKYKFNNYVSAHLWSEFLWEGDFYAKQQMMDFLRAEVMFTF